MGCENCGFPLAPWLLCYPDITLCLDFSLISPSLVHYLEKEMATHSSVLAECSCLENPRDGGSWWAAVYGVAQSWTRLKRLSSSSKFDIYWSGLVVQLCPAFCDTMDCSPPDSYVHRLLQAKNIGVGCHFLLQEIFLTRGSNPGLLHCRQIFLPSEPPGKYSFTGLDHIKG